MLESIELDRRAAKAEYKARKGALEIKLSVLQRRAHDLGVPTIVVFEGWDAAGKGTLINDLILPLDPRGVQVYSALAPNEEEALRPFLWRFWTHTPARGRITVYDRSWYRRVLQDGVDQRLDARELQSTYRDIRSFERQLSDDGNVLIKFFLHISKQEQKRRFAKLKKNKATAWRVTKEDEARRKRYDAHLKAAEAMLAETESDFGAWTVVEAHDRRFAALKIFTTVAAALDRRIALMTRTGAASRRRVRARRTADSAEDGLSASVLEQVDLSQCLERDSYRRKLKKRQKRLRELEHEIYMRRVPVVIVYEGWDAAGKGGNIRRLVQKLDPRGYEVVPIAAPNDLEKAHHYLWRFWTHVPKAGHITVFDRSWYGRVLVERVEGFCSEEQWGRAYREINELEQHLTDFGTVLLKFWLQIDPQEQLRRFKRREKIAYKRWKITGEDWRNREKWGPYKSAVTEMLARTSTPRAPWTVVASNCKLFARIKTLESVIEAVEARLAEVD